MTIFLIHRLCVNKNINYSATYWFLSLNHGTVSTETTVYTSCTFITCPKIKNGAGERALKVINAFEKTPRISCSCKLVWVQCREYEVKELRWTHWAQAIDLDSTWHSHWLSPFSVSFYPGLPLSTPHFFPRSSLGNPSSSWIQGSIIVPLRWLETSFYSTEAQVHWYQQKHIYILCYCPLQFSSAECQYIFAGIRTHTGPYFWG